MRFVNIVFCLLVNVHRFLISLGLTANLTMMTSSTDLPTPIMTSSSDFYAAEDKQLQISCLLRETCDCEINILLPNKRNAVTNDVMSVIPGERHQKLGSVLQFNSSRDGGTYECVVSRGGESKRSERVVTVVEKPHLSLSISESVVEVYLKTDEKPNPLTISVDYDADPQPTFTWFDNNQEIVVLPQRDNGENLESRTIRGELSESKVHLHFQTMNYDHSGNYTLVATNAFREQQSVMIEIKVFGEKYLLRNDSSSKFFFLLRGFNS